MQTRWLLVFAAAICACSDNDPKAPLLSGGGGSWQVAQGGRDGGMDSNDEDAGEADAATDGGTDGPAPNECVRIEALRHTTDDIPEATSTATPEDFLVTRQAATWRDDCSELVIELSNGVCPNGNGHELEIRLSADAVEDGQIGLGLHPLEAEPMAVPGYRVRYTRPDRFSPEGVYGSCTGSSGTINFYDAPDLTRSMNLRATYEFRLTPCDDMRNSPQEVAGYFDVRLRRPRASACPP